MNAVGRARITQRLIGLAAEQVGVDPREITVETHLVDDLSFDSLDTVEFVMKIEEVFEIAIPDEYTQRVRTVGQAADLLMTLMETSPCPAGR